MYQITPLEVGSNDNVVEEIDNDWVIGCNEK